MAAFSLLAVGHAEALVELRRAGLELVLRERPAEDEVADVVAEVGDLAGRAAERHAQRHVEAEGAFRLQVRVADLEREVAGVLAEEEQLFERGVPRRPRQADGDRHDLVGGSGRTSQPGRRTRTRW